MPRNANDWKGDAVVSNELLKLPNGRKVAEGGSGWGLYQVEIIDLFIGFDRNCHKTGVSTEVYTLVGLLLYSRSGVWAGSGSQQNWDRVFAYERFEITSAKQWQQQNNGNSPHNMSTATDEPSICFLSIASTTEKNKMALRSQVNPHGHYQ